MKSPTEFSARTLSVLAALCERPSQWRHGYTPAGPAARLGAWAARTGRDVVAPVVS